MLNRITVQGRCVRDLELKHTQSGTPVCSFSIACERDYKDADGNKTVDFLDVVAWRKLAETICTYMTKGKLVIVDGRLQLRDWTDREGNKRRSAEIVANSVNFGDSRPQNQAAPAPSYAAAGAYSNGGHGGGDMDAGDELPF